MISVQGIYVFARLSYNEPVDLSNNSAPWQRNELPGKIDVCRNEK
jgi:hypothetical protein